MVEVEGDIREEFDHYSETPTYLHFSDGTIVSAQYNGGMWDVEIPRVGPKARVTRRRATNDDDDYSDVVTLTVPDEKLAVERWSDIDPPTEEIAERLSELIEGGALESVGRDELLTIWGIVQRCRLDSDIKRAED